MKIGRLDQLTELQYRHLLANYHHYSDFNSLGLFRSLLENEKLDATQRLRLRDAAIEVFPKFFEFLQLKDPRTYLRLQALGQGLTVADEQAAWEELRRNQQRLLADKRIRHRNLGTYGRHDCGYPDCPFNGLMVRQNTWLAESRLHFDSDRRSRWQASEQSRQRRQGRKAFNAGRNTRLPEDL
ncbi:hypothetical protein GCM10027048_33940 [Hymenobacter coalescens]